ncbi:MAG: Methyltransferase type 11 [candidate division WS6 bacterium GW2011_GWD1_35_594]|nr:MAG: Methyltransferase type 11 [candidate division TM6 bacterium GW2011_GWF2_33_332]KKP81556.1 MAG: Methyltransferase type 11 [candidate division WS6 bacterium GW2011_GWD1_35_594]
MKFTSTEDAHKKHQEQYISDGVLKGMGTIYSHDHYRARFVLDSVPVGSYLLDVGCNGGTLAIPLKTERKCYVKAIDIQPVLVEKAKKRGIYAEVGTAEDLSRFDDNSFDVVICCEVLEHLFDASIAVKEAHRVLRSGGLYIITVPHPLSTNRGLGDYHHKVFTLDELKELIGARFGSITAVEIPYTRDYCDQAGVDYKCPQWHGIIGIKN